MKNPLFLLLLLPAIAQAQCIPTDSIRYDINGDLATTTTQAIGTVPCMATCQPQGTGSVLAIPDTTGMIQVWGQPQQVHLQITIACSLVILDTCLQLTGRLGQPYQHSATWPATAQIRIFHADTIWTWFEPTATGPALPPAIYNTDTLCATLVTEPIPQGMPEGEPEWYDLNGHHHAIPPRGILVIDRISKRKVFTL